MAKKKNSHPKDHHFNQPSEPEVVHALQHRCTPHVPLLFSACSSARRAVSRASGASWRHKPRGKFVARGDRSGVSEVPKLDR